MDAKHEATAVTPALAKWASELTLAAVPAEVVSHLKTCLLDTIGCALGAVRTESGRIALDYVHLLGGTTDYSEDDFTDEPSAKRSSGELEARVTKLEQELAELKTSFDKLMKELMG